VALAAEGAEVGEDEGLGVHGWLLDA
jgi:hypothetical protein